jgi:MFS family permease
MMVPVGRLILVRSVEKSELIGAMTLMSMPALVGPMLGPPIGGLITEFASWRWIFWVNLPIGLAGYILVGIFVSEVTSPESRPFDFRGFVLSGVGLSASLFGLDTAATDSMPLPVSLAFLGCGIPLLVLYALHARSVRHPILDLKVLRVPTLAASMLGGSLFRTGLGALPFLLPLMLQEGLGYTPLHSGLITLASSIGAFGSRGFISRVLRRFGFRTVLISVSLIAALFMASYGFFRVTTPILVMLVLLASGSVFRTLGFGSLNALAFADVPEEHVSQATGFVFMAQRLSQTTGVALAAFVLHVAAHGGPIPPGGFGAAFFTIAVISSLSALIFLRLDADSGADLSGHPRTQRGQMPEH